MTYTKKGNRRSRNQDVITHGQNDEYEVIALADGVSSCKKGKEGAEIACKTVSDIFLNCGRLFFNYSRKKTANIVLDEIKRNISIAAKHDNEPSDSYSSTICFVCLEKRTGKIISFQLGDSHIFLLSKDGCDAINAKGAYELCFTTYPDADEYTFIDIFHTDNIQGLLLCSDGAWKLLYNKNILNPEILHAIKHLNFEIFEAFLKNKNNTDDCSYILLNLENEKIA